MFTSINKLKFYYFYKNFNVLFFLNDKSNGCKSVFMIWLWWLCDDDDGDGTGDDDEDDKESTGFESCIRLGDERLRFCFLIKFNGCFWLELDDDDEDD